MGAVVLVGLGRIGTGVARSLVRAGHTVRVVDVRTDARTAAIDAGAHWTGHALDRVAGDEVLITILPGSPELRELMLGEAPDVFDRMRLGSIWVDLTSSSPELVSELSAAADRRGVEHLDAGVGGGPDAALRGELTLFVGGAEATVRRCGPVLASMARRIEHVGGPGAGTLTKLLVNQLWFGQAVAHAEALLHAASAGIDPARFLQVLDGSAAAGAFASDYGAALLAGDVLPAFGLDRIVEELDSLQRAARAARVPMPVAAAVAALHRDALAHFGPRDGELLGVSYLEHLAGASIAEPATPAGPA